MFIIDRSITHIEVHCNEIIIMLLFFVKEIGFIDMLNNTRQYLLQVVIQVSVFCYFSKYFSKEIIIQTRPLITYFNGKTSKYDLD